MRGKYEFGMRAFLTSNSAGDLRKQMILDLAKTQGMTEQQIVGSQKAIGMSCTFEQLRKAIQKKLRGRGLSPVTSADGGHRPYEARLIGEA